MKYKKFHRLIEKQNPEQKQVLHQKLKQDLNISESPAEKQPSAFARFFKKPARLAACISAAVAVVCLAIILPFALNSGATPQTPSERYCYANDCNRKMLDCNLKEYAEQNNLSILYLDWYDLVDEFQTFLYVNKDDETDIVYIEEIFIDGANQRIITVDITDMNTRIDKFEDEKDSCEYIEYISSVKVLWSDSPSHGKAYVEYSGYRYLIEVEYYGDGGAILDMVRSMLPQT